MYQNARLVNHRQIQRAPVLEEREVRQLIVECEVPVHHVIVGCERGRATGYASNIWYIDGIPSDFIE